MQINQPTNDGPPNTHRLDPASSPDSGHEESLDQGVDSEQPPGDTFTTSDNPCEQSQALFDQMRLREERENASAAGEFASAYTADVVGLLSCDAGDLTQEALTGWVQLLAGPSQTQRVLIERHLEMMRCRLGGFDPSIAESLVIDRILILGLQLANADRRLLQGQKKSAKARRELARQQAAVSREYIAAVKQLAQVQKPGRGAHRQSKGAPFGPGPGELDPLRQNGFEAKLAEAAARDAETLAAAAEDGLTHARKKNLR